MLTHQASTSAIQMAVLDYFAGERSEMLIAMAAILVVAVSAVSLFIRVRTGFSMALMLTVLLFGSVMAAGFASLMIRDHTSSHVLIQSLQSERYAISIASEKRRIDVVLSKFKYYRYVAVVLGMIAMMGLMLSSRGWVHGVAAGLLLVVVAQVIIDHLSEERAHIYFEKVAIT